MKHETLSYLYFLVISISNWSSSTKMKFSRSFSVHSRPPKTTLPNNLLHKPLQNSSEETRLHSAIKDSPPTETKLCHAFTIQTSSSQPTYLQNALINAYAGQQNLQDARKLFDEMPHKTVVSWTVMITSFLKNRQPRDALNLFYEMQASAEVKPNNFTFSASLSACSELKNLTEGLQIHAMGVKRCEFVQHLPVCNALIHMYVKCDRLDFARQVFDEMPQRNVISWTSVLAGYVLNDNFYEALRLYDNMVSEKIEPSVKTFATILPACTALGDLKTGMAIHQRIKKSGLMNLGMVLESALVGMYAKCGELAKARQVFDKMRERDLVSWTVMICGCAQNGAGDEVLRLYEEFKSSGLYPSAKIYASVLSACAEMGALELGIKIYDDAVRKGFESDFLIENCLVDLYAKCGCLDKARGVFDNMCARDVVSWTCMISGYASHGQGEQALKVFAEMERSEIRPNLVTFVCVLSACCHSGLVEQGLCYFGKMVDVYGIEPCRAHYSCMVDLLGRAGRLDEACDMVRSMKVEPDASMLRSLLGACRIHGNVHLAEQVAKRLIVLEPNDTSAYVLLSNMYAESGRKASAADQ